MDKKTLLALSLIFLVFIISSELIWKPQQKAKLEAQKNAQAENAATETQKPTVPDTTTTSPNSTNYLEFTDNDSIAINDNLILENDLIRYVFTNDGGNLIAVYLKDYQSSNRNGFVNIIPADTKSLDFQIIKSDKSIWDLDSAVFQYELDANSLVFHKSIGEAKLQKKFTISDDYRLELEFKVDNFSDMAAYRIGFGNGIADTEKFLKFKEREYKVVAQINNEIYKKTLKSLKVKQNVKGKIDWAAVRSKYFIMALISDDLTEINRISSFRSDNSPAFFLDSEVKRESFTDKYSLYFGPLSYNNLITFNNGIEQSAELGPKILRPIAKLFTKLFNFLHNFIPSWGACLIIFAILIKLLLYPLTHKSFESSSKMQKVQPLVREIQAKYKHDPILMNKETQKIYKEHGVNPLGGCLPMLLQMPIFFALYPVLRYSIDLRQAGFLWLSDLSEPDPYMIMPIMMGIFMFLQSFLMQPAKKKDEEIDEKQKAQMQSQKMMTYIMPVFMFFLFKSFPAGLVMYWTVFNIFSIIQMLIIRKKFN